MLIRNGKAGRDQKERWGFPEQGGRPGAVFTLHLARADSDEGQQDPGTDLSSTHQRSMNPAGIPFIGILHYKHGRVG